MIKPDKITPETVDAYGPDGFIGTLNEYEFNDLRIKIKNAKFEGDTGYYISFNGYNIEINKHGVLKDWPKGLFSLFESQCMILINWNSK